MPKGPVALARIETALVALVWCVLVVCVSVVVLTIPRVTSLLVDELDVAAGAGLTAAEAREAAERVRLFVTSADAPTPPATFAGRAAFDADAVSHLTDVRGVLGGFRAATGIAALVLVVWIGVSAARSRWDAVARAVEWGGWTTVALIALTAVFGMIGFDDTFAAMHGVFFEPGTWQFPADSLLIQIFPESFWVSMGAIGGVLALLGGLLLALAGRRLLIRRSPGIKHPGSVRA